MKEPAEEDEMEKRGVECDCANCTCSIPKELTKTADGYACPFCGQPHKSLEEGLTRDQE